MVRPAGGARRALQSQIQLAHADALGGADDIPDNSATTATVAVGGSQTSWINSLGDHDWFAIQLTAGTTYQFTLVGVGATPLDAATLDVFDSSGQLRISRPDLSPLDLVATFTPASSGAFYLSVSGFNEQNIGQYALSAFVGGAKPVYSLGEIIDVFSRWGNPWTIDEIGFTFLQSSASTGFQPFAAQQMAAVRSALTLYSDIINLNFVETDDDGNYDGEITFENIDHAAFVWGTGSGGGTSGDVNVDNNNSSGTYEVGSNNFLGLLHEIGHALNVPHPGDYNNPVFDYEHNADYAQDSQQYTVMSFWEPFETGANHDFHDAATPLLHDVLALQAIYGANMSTRTGNSIYGFNSNVSHESFDFTANIFPVVAIWDAGGIDAIDLSGYNMSCVLNLAEASFSNVGGLTGNLAICYGAAIENGIGGSAADIITGNALANRLSGLGGADSLQGEAGADTLDGGAGTDSLFGGADNDTLVGGAGADSLAGGAGTDTADYTSSASAVSVNLQTATATGGDAAGDTFVSVENVIGSALNDTLIGRDGFVNVLSGGLGDDTLSGGIGADTMHGGDGIDTLDYSLSPNGVDVRLFSGLAAGGSANGDVYSGIENIIGAATKTDTLAGDDGANSIWGGGGNETITGRDGSDHLFGEAGNDTLLGGAADDFLVGGAGLDTLGGGVGNDTADYSASETGVNVNLATGLGTGGDAQGDALVSIENVLGSAFGDVIIGKANTTVNVFDGGAGDDTMTGGLGNDTFVFRFGQGSDVITDFSPLAASNNDVVQLLGFGAAFDSFAEIIAAGAQIGADTVVAFGAGQTLILQNVAIGTLTADDFIFGP